MRWLRWTVALLVVVAGAFMLAAPAQDCQGFGSSSELAGAAVGAAIGAAIVINIVALVIFLIRRARKRSTTWLHAVLSFWTLGIAFALIFLSGIGQAVQRAEACGFIS